MSKLLKTALLGVIFLGATAQAKNQPDNPWTDCGIGYAIFKDSEIGAAISNVIWDAGTTATTTFISTPDNCRSRDGKVAQFVGETYDHLERETAVGSGTHVTAMLNIARCDAASHQALTQLIRDEYRTVSESMSFEGMQKADKAGAYFSVVSEKVNASLDCAVI